MKRVVRWFSDCVLSRSIVGGVERLRVCVRFRSWRRDAESPTLIPSDGKRVWVLMSGIWNFGKSSLRKLLALNRRRITRILIWVAWSMVIALTGYAECVQGWR